MYPFGIGALRGALVDQCAVGFLQLQYKIAATCKKIVELMFQIQRIPLNSHLVEQMGDDAPL